MLASIRSEDAPRARELIVKLILSLKITERKFSGGLQYRRRQIGYLPYVRA